MKNIIGLNILICFLFANAVAAQSLFVHRNGNRFSLGNKPYYYIGANYWYGGYLGLGKNKKQGIKRLQKELDFLKANGVTNLRVLAGAEGSGSINGVQRVKPALQPQQGIFDEKELDGLDVLLTEMGKRNMKAVLFLSNNWEWSGGFLQYLNWNGLIPDSILRRKLSWDEMRDYVSKFYSCTQCIQDYKKQVDIIINHTNSISGKKYKNDPAIMAWELANEPRPMRPAAIDNYKNWITSIAAFIKSKDKNHLLTLGTEGEMGTENLSLYKQIHADKNVDYLTIHIWPKNWGWFKEETLEQGFPSVITKTIAYIDKHKTIAEELQKPLVIEEFGLPRDHNSFDINSATTLRDKYYQIIFDELKKSKAVNGVIGGLNFWAFGGTARPVKGQIFWKDGDKYMGDPPMEEQGLNSVFDSDTSTWRLIKSFYSQENLPIDKNATRQTVNLYHSLQRLLNKGIMFGHQDDLAYGVGWKYIPDKSDVKEVTGDYPAVYGWELGRLEVDHSVNIDTVPFDMMKSYIKTIYDRGGIITLSWHLNNPLTGKTAWDPAPGTVASILPGGEKNELYKSWLDKIASFAKSLKGKNGEFIPVIFRPFHELNGNWYWWGKDHCSPAEFKQLYQFTVSYLRDTKKVHNFLYAFNTDRFSGKEEYLLKYPGDEWVDVIGFDIYQRQQGAEANEQFIKDIDKMLTCLEDIAQQHNKIPALTEFGYREVPDSTWWTNVLWKGIHTHRISYALTWRNEGMMPSGINEYYCPYKGQVSENDFKKFYKLDKTLFQKEVTKQKIYSKYQ